jgi:hypothetical protein
MGNQISTKIIRLDLNFILDNCFRPGLWDKVWNIFSYNGYKITFELQSIDTKNKQVNYTLRLYSENKSYYLSSIMGNANFQKEHRNLEVIQKGINGKVLRWLIEGEEKNLIKRKSAYIEAKEYEDSLADLVEEKAKDLLDELGISHSDIRDAYIESQKYKHSYSGATDRVFKTYKGTVLTKLYLAYCLFTDDKENYEVYKKIARLNGFKIGELRKEIKSDLEKIECGDMYEELEMDQIR